MPGLLIVAHAPLASALRSVAAHTDPEGADQLRAVDVLPDMTPEDIERLTREALKQVCNPQALILCDVLGATPCNIALRCADGVLVQVVAGVNVPMLWRCMAYAEKTLDELVKMAQAGGIRGVVVPSTDPF
jgi:mannose PTS system EIIA component